MYIIVQEVTKSFLDLSAGDRNFPNKLYMHKQSIMFTIIVANFRVNIFYIDKLF